MHEFVNNLCQSRFVLPILPTIRNSTRVWCHLGLPTLLTAGEREQGGVQIETEACKSKKKHANHLCIGVYVLLICNLSNLTLYRLLALPQDSFTETPDEQCVCCIRDEHTCGLYLIH